MDTASVSLQCGDRVFSSLDLSPLNEPGFDIFRSLACDYSFILLTDDSPGPFCGHPFLDTSLDEVLAHLTM